MQVIDDKSGVLTAFVVDRVFCVEMCPGSMSPFELYSTFANLNIVRL